MADRSIDFTSTEAEDHARALLDLSIALVDAGSDVLSKHIRSDDELKKESVLMPGGTVGKHFRHVIDMFQALLDPLPDPSTSKTGAIEINYDAPQPKSRRSAAKSLAACCEAIADVRKGLVQWKETSGTTGRGGTGHPGLAEQMQRKVRLVAVTPTRQVMESTVGRELWFCSLHAIHHYSMLRTIAVHELGLSLPVEFGTAPSTLLYRGPDWKPPTERKEVRVVKSKL